DDRRRRRGPKGARVVASSPALPLLDRLPVVLALEALHAARRVDEPLLPGEEGVALGADLDLDGRSGGAGVNDLSAVARNRRINVVRMNRSLHGSTSLNGDQILPASTRKRNKPGTLRAVGV